MVYKPVGFSPFVYWQSTLGTSPLPQTGLGPSLLPVSVIISVWEIGRCSQEFWIVPMRTLSSLEWGYEYACKGHGIIHYHAKRSSNSTVSTLQSLCTLEG